MKAPICGICLNSNILCMACKKRLDSGEITEGEVRISRLISELAKGFGPLNEITVKKVIEGDNVSVVICNRGDGAKLIGKEGSVIKKLSRLAQKTIRVVEETDDMREFVQNLIYPVPVIGLNILYKPEREVMKIIIPKGRSLPLPEKAFAEIISAMFNKASMITHE